MGMYTEVFFRAEVDEVSYGIMGKIIEGVDPAAFSDVHPFFGLPRAAGVFHCESYYHPGPFHRLFKHETPLQLWAVSFRSSLKNYDGEIEAFFDWVTPHVFPILGPQFIGYSLYEEATVPTLYYAKEN